MTKVFWGCINKIVVCCISPKLSEPVMIVVVWWSAQRDPGEWCPTVPARVGCGDRQGQAGTAFRKLRAVGLLKAVQAKQRVNVQGSAPKTVSHSYISLCPLPSPWIKVAVAMWLVQGLFCH